MGGNRRRQKPVTLLPRVALDINYISFQIGAPLRLGVSLLLLLSMLGLSASKAMAQSPLRLVQSLLMPEVPWGPYADHMAVDLNGHRLFATPQANKAVDVFDLTTGKLLKTITGFGNPHAIFYQSEADQIYVTDGTAGAVKVFSGKTYELVKTIPLESDADGIQYDPEEQFLYVANGGHDAGKEYSLLSIIDTKRGEKIAHIRIDAEKLEALAIDDASSRIYVNLPTKNAVAVIDRQKRSLVASWAITKGKTNMAMAFDPVRHLLYIGCRNTDMHGSIVVLDTRTGKEIGALPIGGWVDYLAYDIKRKRIYATCGVGEVYAYEEQNDGHYRQLEQTDTAVMAKTGLYSPELDRFFVAVPHLGGTTAAIRVFQPEP